MKRHITDVGKNKEEISPKRRAENDLNLKAVCSFTHPNELNSSFCLHSCEEFLLLRSKTNIDIMKFEKNFGNHEANFQMSSAKFPVSNYKPAESLNVNQKRLFMNSSQAQKNDIMLSNILYPDCIVQNFQTKKAQLAPTSASLPSVIASLSTHGSLELSSYAFDNEINEPNLQKLVELVDIRKKSYDLDSTYAKYEKLQEILKELTFCNFDWCPEIIDGTRFIAAVTKSHELIIYSMNSECQVAVEHHEKLEIVASDLKWFTLNKTHFIFVGTSKGNLTRLSIKFDKGKIAEMKTHDELKGKLQIPITSIQVAAVQGSVSFICTKAHSLEIFVHNTKGSKTFTQYVGYNITGIARCSEKKAEYLITTLNNKVYFLALTDCGTKIDCLKKVDNVSNSEVQQSLYAAYGIAASKNKALIFVALYPQKPFDHLVLKQPLCISINLFSKVDPLKILLNNATLKLTNFFDCVEAVRYVGSSKLESLESLEKMKFEVELSKKFLYYLKLQLIVLQAKVVYYRTRSAGAFAVVSEEYIAIKDLIEVVKTFLLLKSLVTLKKSGEEIHRSMRCLVCILKDFLVKEITKEPFKTAQETFKADINALAVKCQLPNNLKAEKCLYCDEYIETNKLVCNANHTISRCVITKLQLPVGLNNFCQNCNVSVMERKVLEKIIGKDEPLCPFCDRQLEFEKINN